MTFITEQSLKTNIRELRSEIKAVAIDLGEDIKFLHTQLKEMQDIVEGLNIQISKLTNKIKE